MRLKPRVDELERRLTPQLPQRWVQVIQDVGQTQEQAIAEFEAEHGPIEDANVILSVVV